METFKYPKIVTFERSVINIVNTGKVFENRFKASVPDFCLLQRLPDPPQSFSKSNLSKFSVKNPCDFFMFDSNHHILYCLELKSTKGKSMSFEDMDNEEEQNRMIHKHQILALSEFANYSGVRAGFVLNFRDEKTQIERTYFQNIIDFNKMCKNIEKHSFNEIDLIMNNAVKINGNKKRVNYIWDIKTFVNSF